MTNMEGTTCHFKQGVEQLRLNGVTWLCMYKTMSSLGRPRVWRLFSSSTMPCADHGHVLFQEMMPDRFATPSNVAGRPNMPEANSRLKELVKLRQLSSARRMFDNMPHRDEIPWTSMISGYGAARNAREALDLFLNMSGGIRS